MQSQEGTSLTTNLVNINDDNPLFIGGARWSGWRHFGDIDEVRISNTSRSADWIAAQYASMNGTFVNYASAERVPWQSFAWQYRKTLTFNNASQAEDLTNFPALVSLDSSNFDFSATQFDGDDIRFVDANNETSLSYEVESWDAGSQTAHIWV